MAVVEALPRDPIPAQSLVTGTSCPDCSGVLGVRAEGSDAALVFECRIGHTYDVSELLAAKEEALDQKLWTTAMAFDELVALMSDLERRAGDGADSAAYRDRVWQLRGHAAALTQIIRANRPIDLAVDPGVRAGHGGSGSGPAAPGVDPGGR